MRGQFEYFWNCLVSIFSVPSIIINLIKYQNQGTLTIYMRYYYITYVPNVWTFESNVIILPTI